MSRKHKLELILAPDLYAVCRLDANAAVPAWAFSGAFTSVTRNVDELSVVCPQSAAPDDARCERGWRCLRVAGTIDFSTIGVVASLVGPLAEAHISVFVVSTFDTDYLLVRGKDLEKSLGTLAAMGHVLR